MTSKFSGGFHMIMIKSKYFLFIFILCLLLTSCPQDPNKGKGTSAEKRDENGHLQEITYYDKNHNVYKTEYYEYLNKHDDDSRLIKVVINDIIDDEMEQYDRTVEDGQTTYEMKVCWKQAYVLRLNTFKPDHCEVAALIGDRREYFSDISDNKMSFNYKEHSNSSDSIYEYDIETCIGKPTFGSGTYVYKYYFDQGYLNQGYYMIVGENNHTTWYIVDDE